MSHSMTLSSDGYHQQFSLASSGGWTAFGEWVLALPDGSYPTLRELVEDGEAQGTERLAEELKAALAQGSPPPNVKTTAWGMLHNIMTGSPEEIATVTN